MSGVVAGVQVENTEPACGSFIEEEAGSLQFLAEFAFGHVIHSLVGVSVKGSCDGKIWGIRHFRGIRGEPPYRTYCAHTRACTCDNAKSLGSLGTRRNPISYTHCGLFKATPWKMA